MARGIDRQSAVKLVCRQRWRHQEGNNGVARVFVPSDQLTRPKAKDDARAETADEARDKGPYPTDIARYVATFEAILTILREAQAGEVAALQTVIEERGAAVDDLRAQLADASARAERAAGATEAQRRRVAAERWPCWSPGNASVPDGARAIVSQRLSDALGHRGARAGTRNRPRAPARAAHHPGLICAPHAYHRTPRP